MHLLPKFIRDWITPPVPSISERLAKELDEAHEEYNHAKKEFEKWKHSVNLYKERTKRLSDELKGHINEQEQES
jgi:hypothetical protein